MANAREMNEECTGFGYDHNTEFEMGGVCTALNSRPLAVGTVGQTSVRSRSDSPSPPVGLIT